MAQWKLVGHIGKIMLGRLPAKLTAARQCNGNSRPLTYGF
jgi:hypothetical protein